MFDLKLGKHVSISGGIDKAPERAHNLGANCLQMFVKNPRSWKTRTLSKNEINRWKEKRNNYKINTTIVHGTYLINPASPREKLWKKSVNCLQEEFHRCIQLDIDFYVIHPGNHTGSGEKKALNKISNAVNLTLNNSPDGKTKILLENVSGSGTAVGSNLFELYDIINLIDDERKVGICFDTCHAFAAGYNLSDPEKVDEVLNKARSLFGINKISTVHINDSVYGHRSRKDEHAHIGKGKIATEGLKCIVNHPVIRDKAFIVETPLLIDDNNNRDIDINKLLSLRR